MRRSQVHTHYRLLIFHFHPFGDDVFRISHFWFQCCLVTTHAGVSSKQRVAYVVAHELAHQWFGNLVTMQWWKELWLNEGFATWVGNLAVAKFFPEWNIWTQFVSDYANRAFGDDGLENSHPIEVEVSSSAQVNEIFDAISYCKVCHCLTVG